MDPRALAPRDRREIGAPMDQMVSPEEREHLVMMAWPGCRDLRVSRVRPRLGAERVKGAQTVALAYQVHADSTVPRV